MVEKRSNTHEIHGLVLFKTQKIQENNIQKGTFSFEDVDQENKIKFSYDFIPFSAIYRYSILLKNESFAPITEIKAIIKFPEFLTLTRYSPPNLSIAFSKTDEQGIKQIHLEIDELSEKNQTQTNFYFTPDSVDIKGKLNTYITYVNNKDYIRVLNSEPIEITLNPLIIQPKIIPTNEINKFLKVEGIKKSIKSLGMGIKNEMNSDLFFNHVEQIIKIQKFQLIAKDKEKRIAWFFGTELISNEDILVIGQIVSNKVEILAASKNSQILVALLTKLSIEYKKSILNVGGIIDSINEIYNVECKFCGTVLHYFPKKGESIECKTCHKEQIIW
jgi:hypothetical protein